MEKTCTLCKITKSIEDFYQHIRKGRKKIMISSRCKLCAKEVSKTAQQSLRENDKEKLLERVNESKKKSRETVNISYARGLLICTHKFEGKDLMDNPELVKAYATQLKIKRTLKKIKNGKK